MNKLIKVALGALVVKGTVNSVITLGRALLDAEVRVAADETLDGIARDGTISRDTAEYLVVGLASGIALPVLFVHDVLDTPRQIKAVYDCFKKGKEDKETWASEIDEVFDSDDETE